MKEYLKTVVKGDTKMTIKVRKFESEEEAEQARKEKEKKQQEKK